MIDTEEASIFKPYHVFTFFVHRLSFLQAWLFPVSGAMLIVAFIIVATRRNPWLGARWLTEGLALLVIFALNWWAHLQWFRFQVRSGHPARERERHSRSRSSYHHPHSHTHTLSRVAIASDMESSSTLGALPTTLGFVLEYDAVMMLSIAQSADDQVTFTRCRRINGHLCLVLSSST